MRHELQESKSSAVGTNMESLAMEYEESKSKLRSEGFNHECFDLSLPKAFKVQREKTSEDRVKKLVEMGQTFSPSGIFQHTGPMIITGDELCAAQHNQLEAIQNKKDEAIQKKVDEKLATQEKAMEAAEKWKDDATKMRAPDWKSILAFCLVESNSQAAVSHFKNLPAVTAELERLDWKSYFDFLQDEEEPDPVVAPQGPVIDPQDSTENENLPPAPEENLPQPQDNIQPAPEPVIAPPPQEHPAPEVIPPDPVPLTQKERIHAAVRKAILNPQDMKAKEWRTILTVILKEKFGNEVKISAYKNLKQVKKGLKNLDWKLSFDGEWADIWPNGPNPGPEGPDTRLDQITPPPRNVTRSILWRNFRDGIIIFFTSLYCNYITKDINLTNTLFFYIKFDFLLYIYAHMSLFWHLSNVESYVLWYNVPLPHKPKTHENRSKSNHTSLINIRLSTKLKMTLTKILDHIIACPTTITERYGFVHPQLTLC